MSFSCFCFGKAVSKTAQYLAMERGSCKIFGDFKQLVSLNLMQKPQTIREMLLCDYGFKARNL